MAPATSSVRVNLLVLVPRGGYRFNKRVCVCVCEGNGEVVAGTGEQCPPFDEARCGDGRKATEAQLLGPKGTDTVTVAPESAPGVELQAD